MKIIPLSEAQELLLCIEQVAIVARQATCNDAHCGSIIVQDGEIIGSGFNSPPGESESERRCHCKKTDFDTRVTDKTCCVHAEQRAIMDALRNNSDKIVGSRLYFIRVDSEGNKKFARGEPYCTICSKMTLDAGIKEFVLYREDGIYIYDTAEYNSISFAYKNSI